MKDDNKNLNKNREIIPDYQDLLKITCPKCNSVGRFYLHGFYTRFLYIALKITNCFLKKKISIQVTRIKCQSCGKTHAVLHHDIIPYKQYALSFVLKVLRSYLIFKRNTHEICIEFDISLNLFKAFLDCYHREIPELKAYFKGRLLHEAEIFEDILSDITGFIIRFFHSTKRYFLHFKSAGTFSKYPLHHFHITFFCTHINI